MGIWDETNVDWSTGEGLQVCQLFERAYPDADAARRVADAVGIAWPAGALSHSHLWAALLTAAVSDARLLALGAELLRDPSRQIFADPLIRALGDQAKLVRAAGVAKHGLPESAEEASAKPLDLADSDAQRLLRALTGAYPSPEDVLGLASQVGLDLGAVNVKTTSGLSTRSLLDEARRIDKMPSLLGHVLSDPKTEAFHDEVRDLVGSDWLTTHGIDT